MCCCGCCCFGVLLVVVSCVLCLVVLLIGFKTSRVYGHHAHMLNTYARGAVTHVGVLDGHTAIFWTDTRVSSSVLLTKICPRRVITCFRGSPKKPLVLSHFLGLRISREQHVADSSNHSPYLMKLLSSSYRGRRWKEPAVRFTPFAKLYRTICTSVELLHQGFL